jgi:hypothetical protein
MPASRTVLAAATVCVAATICAPATAHAKDYAPKASCAPGLERAYTSKYNEVRDRHGKRAPGRQIGLWGVVRRNQTIRPARCAELRKSLRQLRQLLVVPKPYRAVPTAAVIATAPAQMPSGVETPAATSTGGSSNPNVNPACESGGNIHAVDPSGTYRGKYQFDQQTWERFGGTGDPAAASEVEQDRVAANVTYDAWPNC